MEVSCGRWSVLFLLIPSQASLVFRVKRNHNYYVHAMIIPSFMLTILVVFGIFWSPVNEENYIERVCPMAPRQRDEFS